MDKSSLVQVVQSVWRRSMFKVQEFKAFMRIQPTFSNSHLTSKSVKRGGVVVNHFLLHLRGQVTRVFFDDLLGERPRAVGVRVVRAPHDMTFTEELDQVQSHEIRLVGRPNLALEDLTRQRFQRDVFGLLSFELSLVAVVHLLNDKWDSSDSRLG